MKSYLFLISLISLTLFSFQCSSNQISDRQISDNISGNWEKVGDEAAGMVVKVEQTNREEIYVGKIIYLPEKYQKYSRINDVLWQNIKHASRTQWTGNVINKNAENKTGIKILKATFSLINNDSLEIYADDKTENWVRSSREISIEQLEKMNENLKELQEMKNMNE